MKRMLFSVWVIAALVASACDGGQRGALDPPVVVDDAAVKKMLQEKTKALKDAGKTVNTKDLAEQLNRAHCELSLPAPATAKHTPVEIYAANRPASLLVGTLYKCDNCPRWHMSIASGFVLTESGAIATNYHVVAKAKPGALTAMTADGQVYPVEEVLAANQEDDCAVLQLALPPGRELTPAPLRPDAPVGTPVAVISNPDNRLYTFSRGVISRYFATHGKHGKDGKHSGPKRPRLSITADFARGSSGGPVFDDCGNVVGMVAATNSIYYDKKDGQQQNLQMVVKGCIPAKAIQALCGGTE